MAVEARSLSPAIDPQTVLQITKFRIASGK